MSVYIGRMVSFKFITIGAVIAALLAFTVTAAGRPLSAVLSGANEIPAGDDDGSGTAQITLNQGQGEVCFSLTVEDITLPAIGAHIHQGTSDVNGPVVVVLTPPDAEGAASGCVSDVDPELIKDIRQYPDMYYVNVHTTDYPGGAIRGQLSK